MDDKSCIPFIKFLFDKETLDMFTRILKDEYNMYLHDRGMRSIKFLNDIYTSFQNGVEDIYIPVTNQASFFNNLHGIMCEYWWKKKDLEELYEFLCSIWIRMGASDILNVEDFLQRQKEFLGCYSFFKDDEVLSLGDKKVVCEVSDNDLYFETNQNIKFSIRGSNGQKYDFPAIHYELVTDEDDRTTCYIYGIQRLNKTCDDELKKELRPIRRRFGNIYIHADFIIALSLFLDYLYDNGITDVEIPVLQVFNYPYHELLSNNFSKDFDSYTSDDITKLEELYKNGDRSDAVEDYIYTKSMVSRFVDKEDSISYNKTERFINTFYELMNKNPLIELVCEPFIQGENLVIRLKGKSNLLDSLAGYQKKKRAC